MLMPTMFLTPKEAKIVRRAKAQLQTLEHQSLRDVKNALAG